MEALVQTLAGVDKDTAIAALEATHWNVEDAIDRLLQKPVCKGDTYLPPKPKLDTGLSDEQKAMCERGRWLQSKVNEVVSVAHSQIRTQQALSAEQTEEPPAVTLPTLQEVELQSTTELSPGSHEQTTPQSAQSELPL
jgi:hypothetical protein